MRLNMCYEAMNISESVPGMEGNEERRIDLLSEQAYVDKKSGRVKAKDSKEISRDSLQSGYDEDATYRKKWKKG